jgi:hypothetical protein
MTQAISIGHMHEGDVIVHDQEDGQFALYDYATRRDNGEPGRRFGVRDQALEAARATASKSGGTVWRSEWKTADKIEPLA